MTRLNNTHNKKFYLEILKAAKGKPILACYYAKPEKTWKERFTSDMKRMKRVAGKRNFEFILASKNIKDFLEQLAAVEVVYFRGGSTLKLQNKLKAVRGKLKKSFSGKTVSGSSAGALFLSKYYFDQDHDKILKGLDILPVKIMTHYLASGKYAANSGKEKLTMLKNHKEKMPTYAIPETKFIILKK